MLVYNFHWQGGEKNREVTKNHFPIIQNFFMMVINKNNMITKETV